MHGTIHENYGLKGYQFNQIINYVATQANQTYSVAGEDNVTDQNGNILVLTFFGSQHVLDFGWGHTALAIDALIIMFDEYIMPSHKKRLL